MICSVVAPGIPKLYIVPPLFALRRLLFCLRSASGLHEQPRHLFFPTAKLHSFSSGSVIGALLLFFSVLSENLLLPPSANSTDPRAAVSVSQ
ncbi:hypothetical protein, partial [Thiolapillus sp.]|uniref:hypothetical protein n=1 Tax=Thiolapillus sp. TaxID=2017437 RepID=UPI003AF9C880